MPTLREELIAKGLIKPVEIFLAHAAEIDAAAKLTDARLAESASRATKSAERLARTLVKPKTQNGKDEISKESAHPTKRNPKPPNAASRLTPNAHPSTQAAGPNNSASEHVSRICSNGVVQYECEQAPKFSRYYFLCSQCRRWIHVGQGLKHEAMHKGVAYFPSSDLQRPKQQSSGVGSNRWITMLQGGLPSLGKRNR